MFSIFKKVKAPVEDKVEESIDATMADSSLTPQQVEELKLEEEHEKFLDNLLELLEQPKDWKRLFLTKGEEYQHKSKKVSVLKYGRYTTFVISGIRYECSMSEADRFVDGINEIREMHETADNIEKYKKLRAMHPLVEKLVTEQQHE